MNEPKMTEQEMYAQVDRMRDESKAGGNFHSDARFLTHLLAHSRENESEEFAEFVGEMLGDLQSAGY
jgi:hypothetical protein